MIFEFNFKIGEKIKCFDPNCYENDTDTPLTTTMRDAVVVARRFQTHYGRWTKLYDVRFNDRLSTNHFESALQKVK